MENENNAVKNFNELKEIKSPLMSQLVEFKEQLPDHIIFLQVGDFYEVYSEDAITVSETLTSLDIKVTKKTIGGKDIPMCGVPRLSGETYASELAKSGKFVALVSQIKGDGDSVRREISRIVTPSTISDEAFLNCDEHQYIMSIYSFKDDLGVVFVDYLSGEILSRCVRKYNIFDIIAKYQPKEVSLYLTMEWDAELLEKVKNLGVVRIYSIPYFYNEMKDVITETKNKFFKDQNAPYVVVAAYYFLNEYVNKRNFSMVTLKQIQYIEARDYLYLHSSALSSLDIFENGQTHKKDMSLYDLLDKCITAKGSRLLRKWIQEPLLDSRKIKSRQVAVEFFVKYPDLREKLQGILKDLGDVERTVARLETKRYKDFEVALVPQALGVIVSFLSIVSESVPVKYMKDTASTMLTYASRAYEELSSVIDGENIIKAGFDIEFDSVRDVKNNGLTSIQNYFNEVRDSCGIKGLKLEDNKVLGYYFEVNKSSYGKVPEYFIERANLSNSKRYVTERLKELEQSYFSALESFELYYKKALIRIVEMMSEHYFFIREAANFVAGIDILLGFAKLSEEKFYKCPEISDGGIIHIEDGRHPLLSAFSYKKTVSNDCILEPGNIHIVTGPNMGGKSCYLKMAGMIVIMAQIGCFVPVKRMRFTPVDRVMVRMGSMDAILNGQSTFMMECEEMAYILHDATENSLVLIDELGRGTSTDDGIALAKSSLAYIDEDIHCKTICSTHYHELIEMEETSQNIRNLHAEVIQTDSGIEFCYKIRQGGMSKSFGIEVAKKAGLPAKVIDMAEKYLGNSDLKVG